MKTKALRIAGIVLIAIAATFMCGGQLCSMHMAQAKTPEPMHMTHGEHKGHEGEPSCLGMMATDCIGVELTTAMQGDIPSVTIHTLISNDIAYDDGGVFSRQSASYVSPVPRGPPTYQKHKNQQLYLTTQRFRI